MLCSELNLTMCFLSNSHLAPSVSKYLLCSTGCLRIFINIHYCYIINVTGDSHDIHIANQIQAHIFEFWNRTKQSF